MSGSGVLLTLLVVVISGSGVRLTLLVVVYC